MPVAKRSKASTLQTPNKKQKVRKDVSKKVVKKATPPPSPPSSESEESMSQAPSSESSSSEDELDDVEEAALSSISNSGDDDSSDDSSDDSLDDNDDDESVKNETDGAAASADGPVDPNKKSSKEQHAEQRKVLAERKLQRKAGTEVQNIKALWEKLRVTKPPPPKQIRDKLADQIWELSKDVILELVMKHDASRVVQTLVKFSSKVRRDVIVKSLKGHFYHLATSAYGKYLLIKLLHYGSKESRALIINELHGKLRKLMRHREGAYVVEDLYVLYATNEQKHQMIREFWGAEYAVFIDSGKGQTVVDLVKESLEKKLLIMSNLYGTISASVEKGSTGFQVLHAAMKEYTDILSSDIEANDKQIREFIELLADQFAELVHTQEGSEVASTLLALATAKERKHLAKTLKAHEHQLIKNEHGNNVLITLYMTIDDTKMLYGALVADFCDKKELPSLIKDKFSRRPLLYLIKGLDGKYFSPLAQKSLLAYQELAYAKTSKKDTAQRHSEIQARAVPAMFEAIAASTKEEDPDRSLAGMLLVNVAAQFITELILAETSDDKVNSSLRPLILQAIIDCAVKGDVLEDYHLINKAPFVSRLLKSLIQGHEVKWDNDSKSIVRADGPQIAGVGAEFAASITNEILDNDALTSWTKGQAAFVVVAIYEALQLLKEHASKFAELKKALSKMKKALKLDTDNKGAQLLAALIK